MTRKEKNEIAKQLIHDICGFEITQETRYRKSYTVCHQTDRHKCNGKYMVQNYHISVRIKLAENFLYGYVLDLEKVINGNIHYDEIKSMLEDGNPDIEATVEMIAKSKETIEWANARLQDVKQFQKACVEAQII